MDFYYGHEEDNKIILDAEESNHLINVKRSHIGDVVYVSDGAGHLFTTEIISIEKKNCILQINETVTNKRNPSQLHIAVAPTKNIERIEWFLEKATETGIDEISFIQCRHSERKEIKTERLKRVMISAMKQSMKTFLPKINPMIDFRSFISNQFSGTQIVCTTSSEENKNFVDRYKKGESLIVLIGPEGDFHADELKLAIDKGFQPTSLGKSRLRTETAALHVCTLFNFLNLPI